MRQQVTIFLAYSYPVQVNALRDVTVEGDITYLLLLARKRRMYRVRTRSSKGNVGVGGIKKYCWC